VAYAARRVLAVAAVVVLTPALTYVVIGSLQDDVPLWTQIQQLPQYLSDTFLHGDLGESGPFLTSLRNDVLDGLPVDVALLIGGLFRRADIGQFRGEQSHIPGLDTIQALVIEASFLIAVTMLLADLLRARLDPRSEARG
jgi:ABC-type dipeptide/oligopeptide/nickel transport system permease component